MTKAKIWNDFTEAQLEHECKGFDEETFLNSGAIYDYFENGDVVMAALDARDGIEVVKEGHPEILADKAKLAELAALVESMAEAEYCDKDADMKTAMQLQALIKD